jgi:hypothetical protein
LLLLRVFKVEVLKVLHGFALYSKVGRPETNNAHKINTTSAANRGLSTI